MPLLLQVFGTQEGITHPVCVTAWTVVSLSRKATACPLNNPSNLVGIFVARNFSMTHSANASTGQNSAHLEGGAAAAGRGVETLDLLAVVVDPATLLAKLGPAAAAASAGRRDDRGMDDGDGFSELGRFVDGIRCCFRVRGRVLLFVCIRVWSAAKRFFGLSRGGGGGGCLFA